MSGIEQNIVKQAIRTGQQIPDEIVNAPELQPDLELYFQAFFDLTGDRTDQPISWKSMADYAMFYNFDRDQTERLFYHIRAMDFAHMTNRKS